MVNKSEQSAGFIRIMREEKFAALNLAFWQDALAQKDNDLQKAYARIAELEQRIGLN